MAKAKIKGFNIISPDIKTVYLGSGSKQKARYIQLAKGFGEDQLDEDIKSGAVIYEPFRETLDLKQTRYNVITAPTEEDGLRAVAYLAGVYASRSGMEDANLDGSAFDEERFHEEISFDEEFIFEDEEDFFEDDSDYVESFDRIPVIDIEEVVAQENSNNPRFSNGFYHMEMQTNANRPRPWWMDCMDRSVCVIKNNVKYDTPFRAETISETEIACLARFSDNDFVYLVIIDPDAPPEDYSVTTAILEYTANHFKIDNDREKIKSYYKDLLVSVAKVRGLTFDKELDIPLLAEKLSRIDREYPCTRYAKIMDYLIHIGSGKCLKADDFKKLGLKKLIDRKSGNECSGTMESDLVGMEGVKTQVSNIMNMLRYVKMRTERDIRSDGYHNVHLFVGAPGTAKTTVAKMMAKAMQEEGLIKGNRFISVTGAQLKGEYVGQTAPKVHALFQQYDAIFIDEAYSLASSDSNGVDSYSQEALAQLAVELEDHALDKLVIFAGYGGGVTSKKNNLMKRFLQSNPGISSRINSTVFFDSYSPQDMVEIVHRLAHLSSLTLPAEQDPKIAEFFRTRQDAEDFGNGREARVFLEHCERSVAERVAGLDKDKVSDKDLNTVTETDITYAIEEMKNKHSNELGRDSRFGFS